MQEYYKVLNISADATNEEVENAYKTLKAKYSKERFMEGEIGNEAARMLTKVETAYFEIMENRKHVNSDGKTADYTEVEKCLKSGDIAGAQAKLDNYTERDAEWHYLQSVIFYKKNWSNESKKQLEIAMNMDPHNNKYADAYTKLKQKMDFNESQFKSGSNANYQQSANANTNNTERQMGGTDDGGCLSYCASLCCLNCLCNACCNCR